MRVRRVISKTFGVLQTAVGVAIMIFAFLFFYNFFSMQEMLGIAPVSVGIYLWISIIFGLLSIISGLFLFYER
jgi:hypothetical protein